MSKSILDGRHILVVDDEPDILAVLEEEIKFDCSQCTIDKATTYEQAHDLIRKNEYDVVSTKLFGYEITTESFDCRLHSLKRTINKDLSRAGHV